MREEESGRNEVGRGRSKEGDGRGSRYAEGAGLLVERGGLREGEREGGGRVLGWRRMRRVTKQKKIIGFVVSSRSLQWQFLY